jgi:hypothetical protein
MEFLNAEWTREQIRDYFELTDNQIDESLNYIHQHRSEVEAEYEQVLADFEEVRRYWDERNRERFAEIARLPPKPGMEEAWAKLQAAKAKRKSADAHSH